MKLRKGVEMVCRGNEKREGLFRKEGNGIQGKRSRGRPNRRWLDSVRADGNRLLGRKFTLRSMKTNVNVH